MPQRKTKILRVVVAALGVVFILLLAGLAESYYERFRAQKLISTLSDIQVGVTTESHAKEITKRFSYFNHADEYVKSNEKPTFDFFVFENRAFRWLHLAPAKWTKISIDYANGIVRSKNALYYEMPGYSGYVNEEIPHTGTIMDAYRAAENGRRLSVNHSEHIPPDPFECYMLTLHEDTTVPLARRQLDWQIDLSCMTSIGGCRDARKVMRGALR
jgi:hypothetical protein